MPDLILSIFSSIIGIFVAKESYSKWGATFLDNDTTAVRLRLPIEDKTPISISRTIVQKQRESRKRLIAILSDVILKEFGPTTLWNTRIIQSYFNFHFEPSPINKCKINIDFLKLPIDGEISLKSK